MRILDNRNIFLKLIDSIRHASLKSVISNFTFLILIVGLAVTYLEVQHRQDIRQRASTNTINCDVPIWSIDSEESQFVFLLNEYRTSKSLLAISMSSNLNRAAEWKVNDLVKTKSLTHSDSLGRPFYQMIRDCGYPIYFGVGENLYSAGTGTAQQAFDAWKNSSAHNENLLNTAHQQIGVARAYGSGIWYWATEFGDGNDGTDGSYQPSANLGAPQVISAIPFCSSDGQTSVTFHFTPGANAIYHELIYNVGSTWDPNGTKMTIVDGQVVPNPGAGGFTPNMQLNYNIRSCDAGGTCKLDPNGYYFINTGPSCYTAPTPTPTPASIGCPASQFGRSNQCRDACLSGSTQVNENPNTACQGAYGASIDTCCNITGTCPSTPSGGKNTCRTGSVCSSGESIYNGGTGNAACANFLSVKTGGAVCCFLPYNTPTPTPVSGINDFTIRANGYLGPITVISGSKVSISWTHNSGPINGCLASSSPINSNWNNTSGSGTPSYQTMKSNGSVNVVVSQSTTFKAVCYYTAGTSPVTKSVVVNVAATPTPTTSCSPCNSSSKNYCVSSTQIKKCYNGCYKTYNCGTGYTCVPNSTLGAICAR